MNKKIIISTIAALLSFSGAASASYVLKFNNSQSKGMIPEESTQSTNSSCKNILDNGKSTGDGVYSITVNNKEFDVYCDMTSAGGGWTMVVAQFETDSVRDWNEGTQPDYDPTLSNKKGFAFSNSELPVHNQVAFGKDLSAVELEFFNFQYTTGNIDNQEIIGVSSSVNYRIHRSNLVYYAYHNAGEDVIGDHNSTTPWGNTLTVDRTGGRYFDWSFSPHVGYYRSTANAGYGFLGQRSSTLEDYAWTVWVR